MHRRLFLGGSAGLLGTACAGRAPTGAPRASPSRVERLSAIASRHIEARPVDVWLPPGYGDARKRHAVLYVHDGQFAFHAATPAGLQSFDIDRTVERLLAQGRLRDCIVVAVHNTGKQQRLQDYYPQKFMAHLPERAREGLVRQGLQGPPRSNEYLRYVVEELKPAIDARYATRTGREDTLMLGSSMGGLVSVYALLEHPNVFGAAAAMSPHWITMMQDNEVFPAAGLAYLREKLPTPGALRLYMDRGTTELDAQYPRAQARVDALLAERGFTAPAVVSRVFDGAGHNERDWAARIESPLLFLLGR
jgi:enterochelin esterase-like enzyme